MPSLDAEDAKPTNWLCEENAPRTLCCPRNICYISFPLISIYLTLFPVNTCSI